MNSNQFKRVKIKIVKGDKLINVLQLIQNLSEFGSRSKYRCYHSELVQIVRTEQNDGNQHQQVFWSFRV